MPNSGHHFINKINLLSSLSMLFIGAFVCSNIYSSIYAASKEVNVSSSLALLSSVFKYGQAIPKQYTADGANVSPPLSWTGVPISTKSLALICEDPDAPIGTWTHWIIYDIPAGTTSLPAAVSVQPKLSDGSKQGLSSFHRVGYGGPSPPPGKPHRYFFKLYALDSMSNLEPGADVARVYKLIEQHKIAQSETMGTYGR